MTVVETSWTRRILLREHMEDEFVLQCKGIRGNLRVNLANETHSDLKFAVGHISLVLDTIALIVSQFVL